MTITRFAPSPTGFLHIGGARTALYAYLLARHDGGKFILRYEDTDQKRLVEEGYDMILQGMRVFGIEPDETYKQSERLEIYKEYAEKLIALGNAYYCFASEEEIAEAKALAELNKTPFRFRSQYRDKPVEEALKRIEKGEKYTIRLKLPENENIEFTDEIQGKISLNTDETDESVLIKSDGYPTYHLAYIVDDYLMNVTHVFRGVEWISSLVKHAIIYRSLNFPIPKFYHLALVLDPEGGKLSKRKGAVAVHDFINNGYLPESLLNFTALLGWTPNIERTFGETEREFFSMQDMIELFDGSGFTKSSAVFNREKLIWFNQKYIQTLSNDDLQNRFSTWLKAQNLYPELMNAIIEKGPDYLNKIMEMEKTRVKLLSEIPESINFYYFHKGNINFGEIKQTKDLTKEQISNIFSKVIAEIESKNDELSDWNHDEWEVFMRSIAEEVNAKAGSVFMALRLALTDSAFTPPLFEVMQILQKKEIIARLHSYV